MEKNIVELINNKKGNPKNELNKSMKKSGKI